MTALAVIPSAPLSTELLTTAERAADYGRNAKSPATRRAYASDLRDFGAYGVRHGLPTLPAAPQTVALYLTALAEAGLSVSTIRRRAAAIAHSHSELDIEAPTSSKVVRSILSGIAREKGVAPVQKAALTIDLLKSALLSVGDGNIHALRDRAILLVGFYAAMRRSEIAALDVEDVRFEPEGLSVTIRRSKTDQEGAGYEIGLPSLYVAAICPVTAILNYVKAAGITAGPLFRTFTMRGQLQENRIDGRDVARIVQKAAKKAGLAGDLSGHSLRAGFVTSAAKAKIPIDAIARVSRHKSVPILLRYVRKATLYEDAPQLLIT